MKCERCGKVITDTITDWDVGLNNAEVCEDCHDSIRALYDMRMDAIENLYFK